MSGRRLTATLLSLALVATACDGEDASDTTAAPDTTTAVPDTTAPEETTTTADSATSTTQAGGADLSEFEEIAETLRCSYLDQFLAVGAPPEEAEGIAADLESQGIAATVVFATEVLEASNAEGVAVDEEVAAELDQIVGLISLTGGDDPLTVSLFLQDQGAPVSPIHAAGLTAHWAFKPGTDAVSISATLTPSDDPGSEAPVIGVVDSGFAPAEVEWLLPGTVNSGGPVIYEDADIEQLPDETVASHGTFITSILRQVASSHRVSIVRAQEANVDAFNQTPDDEQFPPDGYVTSEIQVAAALVRLIQRGHPEMVALNLSLGTYSCDPTQGALLVTLVRTLDYWQASYPGAAVIAAAGNEYLESDATGGPIPFWPAALGSVTGVGAIDVSDQAIVWDLGSPVVPAPSRSWVDAEAPGTDLIGVGGLDTFTWSGSSFATAVATAWYAIGETAPASYQNVPQLSYLDASGFEVIGSP